jgi:hypothetical protein
MKLLRYIPPVEQVRSMQRLASDRKERLIAAILILKSLWKIFYLEEVDYTYFTVSS